MHTDKDFSIVQYTDITRQVTEHKRSIYWRLRFSSDADIVRLTNACIIIIIIIIIIILLRRGSG